MSRPALRSERPLLAAYVLPADRLKPGAPCSILANGGYTYEALVIKVSTHPATCGCAACCQARIHSTAAPVKRVLVEFRKRWGNGVRQRYFVPAEIFVPGALLKLRRREPADLASVTPSCTHTPACPVLPLPADPVRR